MSFLKPLSEITSTYKPLYPENATWSDTVNYLTALEPDASIILTLREYLKTHKHFRSPISLGTGVDDKEGENKLEEFPAVVDGTHRMVASILEDVEDVLVRNANDDKGNLEEEFYVSVKVVLKEETLPDDEDERENVNWKIFDYLRSFELTDDIWAVSDVGFGSLLKTTHCYFEVPTTEQYLRLIEEKVKEQLAAAGLDKKVKTVKAKKKNLDS